MLTLTVAPYYAFGFLLLKYMSYHSLPGLHKTDLIRWAPITAGIIASVACASMMMLCSTSRFQEDIQVLLWALVVLFDLLLLIAWIKAVIKDRREKKRQTAERTTAPPPFNNQIPRPPDGQNPFDIFNNQKQTTPKEN